MSSEIYGNSEQVLCVGTGRVIGEGQSASVISYEEYPGVVFKAPYGATDGQEMLFLEKGRHTVLHAAGIHTLESYDVVELVNEGSASDQRQYCARMPDLTDGGQNYVFSVQDAFRYSREYLLPYPIDLRPEGTVANATEFFHQLGLQIQIAAAARVSINGAQITGIKIETPGLFLVVKRDGQGQLLLDTVIADFHDGQTFGTTNRHEPQFDPTNPEYYGPVRAYLAWVVRFYPELTSQADAFLHAQSNGQCSLSSK